MTTAPRTLPHDDYIEAVWTALDNAGLPTEDFRTDDCETRGTHCYLNAVIELDFQQTSHAEDWPHGLLLIWEWHTGFEAEYGEPDRGPQWLFAEIVEPHGESRMPTSLPVYGYASPAAVVEAARKVVFRKIRPTSFDGGPSSWTSHPIGDSWEHADELDAACEAWGTDEGSE
jgi:hypothetical protein